MQVGHVRMELQLNIVGVAGLLSSFSFIKEGGDIPGICP